MHGLAVGVDGLLREGAALDLAHGEVQLAGGGGAELVDRHDAGVGQLGHELCLLHEPRGGVAALHQLGMQRLDRYPAPEDEVALAAHLGHAASAQQLQIFVAGRAPQGQVARRHRGPVEAHRVQHRGLLGASMDDRGFVVRWLGHVSSGGRAPRPAPPYRLRAPSA